MRTAWCRSKSRSWSSALFRPPASRIRPAAACSKVRPRPGSSRPCLPRQRSPTRARRRRRLPDVSRSRRAGTADAKERVSYCTPFVVRIQAFAVRRSASKASENLCLFKRIGQTGPSQAGRIAHFLMLARPQPGPIVIASSRGVGGRFCTPNSQSRRSPATADGCRPLGGVSDQCRIAAGVASTGQRSRLCVTPTR